MTEFCLPSSPESKFSCLIISDFMIFWSYVLSHPLYFSYLVFFSPYLLKLFTFLSPLFITTTLLLVSLLTALVPFDDSIEHYLLSAYNTLLEKARWKADGEVEGLGSQQFEELELYKIVFGDVHQECEMLTCDGQTIENVLVGSKPNKVEVKEESTIGKGSKALENKTKTNDPHLVVGVGGSEKGRSDHVLSSSQRLSNVSCDDEAGRLGGRLGSFGSMRKEKEKEWRRTLACKLFEERHNVHNESGEGMDLLWEVHEESTTMNKAKKSERIKEGRRAKVDELSDQEDDFGSDGHLCCLQALKFSAGKMNLGMGRPNLVKMSKAFKGIGWLQKLSKHGRKGSRQQH